MAALNSLQLAEYYRRVDHPHFSVAPSLTVESLKVLMRHHLSHIPYENLALHYSTDHKITLDLQSVYKKFVEEGRGGYCLENNTLFAAMLRGLGFKLATVGAKVWRVGSEHLPESEQFGGWGHMVIIVHLPSPQGDIGRDESWLVDVGFGSNGPVAPILLPTDDETESTVVEGVVPEQHRIFTRAHPSGMRLSTYFLQHRRSPTADWTPLYIFEPRIEFSPQDFAIMSYFASQYPQSGFLVNVLCTKIAFDEKGRALSRTLLQNNVVKRREKEENNVIEELKSENDRLKALEKYWGIRLSEAQAAGISGRITEIGEQDAMIVKPVNLVGFT